jgi:hypothetical protein
VAALEARIGSTLDDAELVEQETHEISIAQEVKARL